MTDGQTLSRLFEPVNIGSMTLKNRIAMAPMSTSFCTPDGLVTPLMKDYYEARARGGVGMVIVEAAAVDFYRSVQAANRLAIDSELCLPGLRELARIIKKHGARAMVQLNHSGRQSKTKFTGFQPVGPSPIPYPGGSSPQGEIPRELTVAEIGEIVDCFARAALLAKRAGFEGVEVHAGHGYLLAQFLSPVSNQRGDLYGGSVEKRARVVIEVLKAIRYSCGSGFALSCRMNGREFGVENGVTTDDAKITASLINDLVDVIHVTAFGWGLRSLINMPDTPGELLPLAAGIKKVVTVPVIAVARLDARIGEQAIREGQADIIAIGRGLIADPELPQKAMAGRLEDIRPCISCFGCHDLGRLAGGSVVCSVNANAGRRVECQIRLARKARNIAVIGGGPAGLEAARVLATRGHHVTLLEKEANLGGQLRLAMMAPGKGDRLSPLLNYLMTQVGKLGVDVRLNTYAGVEAISKLGPDVVVLAAGAAPVVPKLPGCALPNVVTAFDVLAGRVKVGRRVAIIGGGSIGCETADFLFEKGHEVTVAEMLPELAKDMGFRDRVRLLNRITTLPINFITGARCLEIGTGGITVARAGKEQTIEADTVVLAVGSRPDNHLFAPLRAAGFETHLAGDCWHVGRIVGAIDDGLRLGSVL